MVCESLCATRCEWLYVCVYTVWAGTDNSNSANRQSLLAGTRVTVRTEVCVTMRLRTGTANMCTCVWL